jgi:hypothetical protein
MRAKARKEYIAKENGVSFYQIIVGCTTIAEYVSERWVDRLVDGYNLWAEASDKELLIRRQIKEDKVIQF